jgi:hypothetical protein
MFVVRTTDSVGETGFAAVVDTIDAGRSSIETSGPGELAVSGSSKVLTTGMYITSANSL